MSSNFKVYVADSQEYFVYEKDGETIKTVFPFFQSVLDLIYIDFDQYNSIFEEMGEIIPKLYSTRDEQYGEKVRERLQKLAEVHIYFEYMLIDWETRMDEIRQKNYIGIVELLPYKKKLSQLPTILREVQSQLRDMLETVLDITTSDKASVSEKMVKYYNKRAQEGLGGFKFEPQNTCYEIIDQTTFTEVIYPTSIYSIIDFLVRECIRRECRFRVCKNCDKYFVIVGYANTEYCDRVFDEQGRTCKEMGALNVWQKKAKKPAYELYSKEYKKRFARIKYGKITKEEFSEWAEEARIYRDRCMADEMEYDAFKEWLDQS